MGCREVGAQALAEQLLSSADNLTDRLAALRLLVHRAGGDVAQRALDGFYDRWQGEALVVNQWFTLQALTPGDEAVDRVKALLEHPAFDWRNPNKVRAVVGAFANANPSGFHRADGAGYALLTDAIIRLQSANPQIASRLCTPLSRFRRYSHGAEQMRAALEQIAETSDLSKDVYEVVQRSLKG